MAHITPQDSTKTASQLAAELSNVEFALTMKAHRPAQLTERKAQLEAAIAAKAS